MKVINVSCNRKFIKNIDSKSYKRNHTGDMTWVVQLPEGSRPGKHEILVPEGEVDLFSVTISSLHFAKWNTRYRERCTLPLLQSVPSILQNTKWNSKYMEEVHFVSITVTSFHFKKYTGHIISKAMRRAALLICPYTCSFCERNHPWTVQSTGLGKKTCNKYSWDSYSLWNSQLGLYFQGEGNWIAGRYLVHPLHTVSSLDLWFVSSFPWISQWQM